MEELSSGMVEDLSSGMMDKADMVGLNKERGGGAGDTERHQGEFLSNE